MSFLKTLFWIVVTVIVALFCFNNWTVVAINLWNGLILETKLPILLGAFFLLGLLPPLLLWQATRYRLRRRTQIETGMASIPAPMVVEPAPLPPAGPIAPVPPGGA
jgi:lipopolysaccharide assembly protein A